MHSFLVVSLTQNGWKKWMGPRLQKLIASKFMKVIGLQPFSADRKKQGFSFVSKKLSQFAIVDRLGKCPYKAEIGTDSSEALRVEKEKNDLRWRFLAVVADRVFLIAHILFLCINLGFFSCMLLM